MDIASLIPMFIMMQILPALTGGGGDGNHNVVLLPVAIGQLSITTHGPTLPVGVDRDRRTPGKGGRRDRPGGGRRMSDGIGFVPPPFIPASPYFPY